MTRREVITKRPLSWVRAAEVLGVSARHMRRIRRRIERHGMSAVMDQRGWPPRRKRIRAGTIAMLCRLKRYIYQDFSVQHFYLLGAANETRAGVISSPFPTQRARGVFQHQCSP
jgi:hypothetical protein